MMKILSIIIPSYNMEAYLPKCLGSLIIDDKELLQKLDVVVVNDGSKDRTSEIAHEFEAKYPGVFRVIDKPNGNYGSCINAALPTIQGRYVRILDADDSYETLNLQKYLGFLIGEAKDVDMVLTDTVNVDDKSGAIGIRSSYQLVRDVILPIEEVLSKVVYFNMNTIAYRSEIFKKFQYRQTEGISYTDTQWSFLPLAMVKRVIYWPEIVYRYTTSREGQTMMATTIAKNFWMMGKCALDTARQYVTVCDRLKGRHRELMDAKIIGFASLAYNRPFKKVNGVKYNIDLETYDRELREISPWIYDAVGETKGGTHVKCRCAANWRKHSADGYIRLRLFAFARDIISCFGALCRKT